MNSLTKIQKNQLDDLHNIVIVIDSVESTKKSFYTTNFNQVFLETLDTALSSFGEACKQTIYHQLEKRYAIKKEEIPKNVEEFCQALTDLFGDASLLLEINIMRILHDKAPYLKIVPQKSELSFVGYLKTLQKQLS